MGAFENKIFFELDENMVFENYSRYIKKYLIDNTNNNVAIAGTFNTDSLHKSTYKSRVRTVFKTPANIGSVLSFERMSGSRLYRLYMNEGNVLHMSYSYSNLDALFTKSRYTNDINMYARLQASFNFNNMTKSLETNVILPSGHRALYSVFNQLNLFKNTVTDFLFQLSYSSQPIYIRANQYINFGGCVNYSSVLEQYKNVFGFKFCNLDKSFYSLVCVQNLNELEASFKKVKTVNDSGDGYKKRFMYGLICNTKFFDYMTRFIIIFKYYYLGGVVFLFNLCSDMRLVWSVRKKFYSEKLFQEVGIYSGLDVITGDVKFLGFQYKFEV